VTQLTTQYTCFGHAGIKQQRIHGNFGQCPEIRFKLKAEIKSERKFYQRGPLSI